MTRNALLGAVAGCVATAPMTVAMEWWHRRLPIGERYPLPPRQITMRVAQAAGLTRRLSERQRLAATLFAHFSYGATMGSLYAVVGSRVARPSIGSGAVFGLVVWLTSYLGLLPALGVLKPATEHPRRRNMLMIVAHLVWGAVAGGLVRAAGTGG